MKFIASMFITLALRPSGATRARSEASLSGQTLERLWSVLRNDEPGRLVAASGQDRWSDSLERRIAGLSAPFEPRR